MQSKTKSGLRLAYKTKIVFFVRLYLILLVSIYEETFCRIVVDIWRVSERLFAECTDAGVLSAVCHSSLLRPASLASPLLPGLPVRL